MPSCGVSRGIVDALMLAAGYRCAECGVAGRRVRRKFSKRWRLSFPTTIPDVFLSVDHVTPRSRGGTQRPDNLRILCTLCNSRRGAAQELRPTLASEEHW